MDNIITKRNLKATGRTKPPSGPEDYNYFLNQLVDIGRLSIDTAVRRYKKEG